MDCLESNCLADELASSLGAVQTWTGKSTDDCRTGGRKVISRSTSTVPVGTGKAAKWLQYTVTVVERAK